MLKLLLGLLPRAGEAAVGLFRFRNEFLLFSEPDLDDGDDDAADDDNDDDDGDNDHCELFLINDPNLCTSPTGEKAVLALGWFGEFQ